MEVELAGRTPLLNGSQTGWPHSEPPALDLSRLQFASPFDLTGMAVLALSSPQPVTIRLPEDPDIVSYLQRMDLFEVLGPTAVTEPSLPPEGPRDLSRPLIELHRLLKPYEVDDLADSMLPRMRKSLSIEACRSLFDILSELGDNATTHGASAIGTLVAAQYYSGKTSEMPEGIWIAVADAGIGIRDHLIQNPKHAAIASDVEAIRLAVRPWVTGTRDRRGWGLVRVLEAAGELAPGIVTVRSGTGEGRFWVDQQGTRTARYREHEATIPGTWIHVLGGHGNGP